jgi:hypothetical protein
VVEKIISNIIDVPCSDSFHGGLVNTGFIDVEKLIHINKPECFSKVMFLEKKFLFSIVVLTLDTK